MQEIKFLHTSFPASFLLSRPTFSERLRLRNISAPVRFEDFTQGVLTMDGPNFRLCAPSHKAQYAMAKKGDSPYVITFSIEKNSELNPEITVTGIYFDKAAEAFMVGAETFGKYEQNRIMGHAKHWAVKMAETQGCATDKFV